MLKTIVNAINCQYGSKRGLVSRVVTSLRDQLGQYKSLRAIQWSEVRRLVFICSGNICRSPLAAVQAQALGFEATSFGLHCSDDYPADPRAIAFARTHNLALESHRTRHIRHFQPQPGDLLVGMEPHHAAELISLFGRASVQITLAGFSLDSPRPYIHDPFSAPPEFFQRCEQEVISAVRNITVKMGGR